METCSASTLLETLHLTLQSIDQNPLSVEEVPSLEELKKNLIESIADLEVNQQLTAAQPASQLAAADLPPLAALTEEESVKEIAEPPSLDLPA